MATWAPTDWTRAVTVSNLLQSRLAHTGNARRLPGVGGARAPSKRVAGAARAGCGSRSSPRRKRSNAREIDPRSPRSARRCAVSPGATAVARVALRSSNGALSPGAAPTDWAITTYSAAAFSAEALGGERTHPESDAGSVEP